MGDSELSFLENCLFETTIIGTSTVAIISKSIG